MGNLFSCLGSASDSRRDQSGDPSRKDIRRKGSGKKIATEEPAELEGLRAFKRPPSKHRQQWVQDSTSSGTTAGIRPGGSSISTVGSVVSSNTLYVPSDDERRPLGKKDWEEGRISTIREEGKDGGPSWEQVQELNGEVSDLRQRLVQEKEEANRLKLMVERLRVSNSGARETSPDDVVLGDMLTPQKREQVPLSSVLATQRSCQQDTCESVFGAEGSPEQMSRPPAAIKEAADGEPGSHSTPGGVGLQKVGSHEQSSPGKRTVTRARRPSARRPGVLGFSLDAQDMVELGSPIVPPEEQVSPPQKHDPQRGASAVVVCTRLGDSTENGSGGTESSSDQGYRSSDGEGSPKYEPQVHRVAPPLGQPSGVLIERRRSHGAPREGLQEVDARKADQGREAVANASPAKLVDAEWGQEAGIQQQREQSGAGPAAENRGAGELRTNTDASGQKEELTDEMLAERRESLRRQSRNERAKARLARRQASQAAAGLVPGEVGNRVRQPLAESHLSAGIAAQDGWGAPTGESAEDSEDELHRRRKGRMYELQDRLTDLRSELHSGRIHVDSQGASDSDMSFGGWLPETRAGVDHQRGREGARNLQRSGSRSAAAKEESSAEKESESFSFGQEDAPPLPAPAVRKLRTPDKRDSPGKGASNSPTRATWAHKKAGASPTASTPPKAAAKASQVASSSDDSLGPSGYASQPRTTDERKRSTQQSGSDPPGVSRGDRPEHSSPAAAQAPKSSSPSQLLNTRERLALKGVLVGPADWTAPRDKASGRAGPEARSRKALFGTETRAEELLEYARNSAAGPPPIKHSSEKPVVTSANGEEASRDVKGAATMDSQSAMISSPAKPHGLKAHQENVVAAAQSKPRPAAKAEAPAVAQDVPAVTPSRLQQEKPQAASHQKAPTSQALRPPPSSYAAGARQPPLEAPIPRRPASARTTLSGASSAASESVQADNPFRIGLSSSQASVQRSPGGVGMTVDQPQHHRGGSGGQGGRVLLRTSSEVDSRKYAPPEPKQTPVARSRSFDAPNLKPPGRAPPHAAHSGLPPRPISATTGSERVKQGGSHSRTPPPKGDSCRAKPSDVSEPDGVPSPFRAHDRLAKESDEQAGESPGKRRNREVQPKSSIAPDTSDAPSESLPGRAWSHLRDLKLGSHVAPREANRARPSSSSQSCVEPPGDPPSKPKHRRRHSHGSNGDLDVFAALPDFKENDDPRPNDEDGVMRRAARSRARSSARGGANVSPVGRGGAGNDGAQGMREMRENTVEVPASFEDPGTPTPVLLYDGRGIPNLTDKYKEDQKVKFHSTPFEIRVERVIAKQEMNQRRLHFPGLSGRLEPSTI